MDVSPTITATATATVKRRRDEEDEELEGDNKRLKLLKHLGQPQTQQRQQQQDPPDDDGEEEEESESEEEESEDEEEEEEEEVSGEDEDGGTEADNNNSSIQLNSQQQQQPTPPVASAAAATAQQQQQSQPQQQAAAVAARRRYSFEVNLGASTKPPRALQDGPPIIVQQMRRMAEAAAQAQAQVAQGEAPTPYQMEPTSNDVLLHPRHGMDFPQFAGNMKLSFLIQQERHKYISSDHATRAMMIQGIVAIMQQLDPPGRFLKYKGDGNWIEVSNEYAYMQVLQMFIRQQQQQQQQP